MSPFPPPAPGDHPLPPGLATEAPCAAVGGRGLAVSDGARHGVAGPRQTGLGHGRARLGPRQAKRPEPTDGGESGSGEDGEDHQRRTTEGINSHV